MNLKNDINNLIKHQKSLKKKILLEEKKVPTALFHDILFYEGMDFDDKDNGELLLAHAYLHKSYNMKEPDLNKESIKKIHVKVKEELINRNQKHVGFDDLDKDTT